MAWGAGISFLRALNRAKLATPAFAANAPTTHPMTIDKKEEAYVGGGAKKQISCRKRD